MSLNFCDLLVLGSDLSGVIAATLLAKRGMNVLLLDDQAATRTPNLCTGLDSRTFRSLLSKLMIPESKIQVMQENKVTCQLVLPRHRVNLTPSRDLLFKEIDREFPAERELFQELSTELDALRPKVLDEFFNFLPLSGRKESKQFIRWLRQLPDQKIVALWQKLSPTLQTFLKLQLRFLSRGPLMEPLTLQLLLYLSPEGCTTYSIRGGVGELKKLFFEKMEYFGSLVHPLGGDGFEILVKGREIRGIQLDRYNFPTRCRFLMGNLNVQHFYRSLPKNLWSYWAKKKMEAIHPLEEHHVVQFEVEREVIPGPMKENLVMIQDPLQPLEGLNYLELNLAPASQKEQTALLTVSYRYPCREGLTSERGEIFYEELHQEIEKRLKKLIPFSDSSLKRIFPKTNGSETLFPEPGDFPIFLGLTQKNRVYPPSFFAPAVETPFRNGLLLGPNLLDWIGMEGKILAALKGVELIWEKESKIKKT